MVIMIILLILCLPLILMLSLLTTTSVVSIAVDVPVNGIDVVEERIVELDLDKNESYVIDYVISPIEASNKDVKLYFSSIGEEKLAEFTVDGNRITPTSYGSARVTVETVDGAYRDSFDVVVVSKRVEGISSSPVRDVITVGETTEIITEFSPLLVTNKALSYRVKDGEDVVSVSSGGRIYGIGIGRATVEVTSVDNPDAKSELVIDVVSSGVFDFVSADSYLTALEGGGTIAAVLNPDVTVSDHSIALFDKDGNPLGDSVVSVGFDPATGMLSYSFIDEAFVGDIEIRLTVTAEGAEPVTKSCYVHRISEISIGWCDQGNGNEYSVEGNNSGGNRIEIYLRPLGADVSYEITLVYNASTDISGVAQSGVAFELVEGVLYTADRGHVSVELESTSEGVYLIVRGLYVPDLLNISATETKIRLSVRDNNTGEVTVLDEISVCVF